MTPKSQARAVISSLPNRNHSSTLLPLFQSTLMSLSTLLHTRWHHHRKSIPLLSPSLKHLFSCFHFVVVILERKSPLPLLSAASVFSFFRVFCGIEGVVLCSVNNVEILWGKSYLRTWAIDWWAFWSGTFGAESQPNACPHQVEVLYLFSQYITHIGKTQFG